MTVEVVAVTPGGSVTATFTVTAPPPPSGDGTLGQPGARPALTVRPGPTSTGPRSAPLQTHTGAQALAAALAAPVEADGRRYLRRARVTSGIVLNAAGHHSIVFEDCLIDGSSNYMVSAFNSGETPAGPLPEFRWCEIRGGTSATVYGGHVRFLRCNLHRGTDIVKASRRDGEYWACWMHDTWHGDGAHCDVVQIVSRAVNTVFHYNRMDGFNAPESPTAGGNPSSGVLQTGTVTGDIGPVDWLNNWFDGGGYTIRSASPAGYTVAYRFRRNRFGRGFRYGPLYGMGGADFDTSNVWDDTGLPVE